MRQRMFAMFGILATAAVAVTAGQQKPTVAIPKPGVPEIMTIEGDFVRAAYNNDGYAIIGYRVANQSVGEEWLMIEVGLTLRAGKPNWTMQRSALSLSTPDGGKIALATNEEYLQVNLKAIQNRLQVQHDSIDYFPPTVSRGGRLGFFSDLGTRTRAYDQVELSPQVATVGLIYFKVPGGIKHGQYWLNVQFKDSLVRVPFRIFTAEELKYLQKNYRDIREQVQEAFRPKK